MERPIKLMIIRTVAIAIVCSVTFIALFKYKNFENIFLATAIPFIIASLNLIFNVLIFRIVKQPIKEFSKKYMINRFLKFIINIVVFLAIIFSVKQNNLRLILVYLVAYIVFFIQEIVELQSLTKKRE